jgi:hypothetical protein
MFDHGLDLFTAAEGVAGSIAVIKDSIAKFLLNDSDISGRVRLMESMLSDTSEFVGLILDLASRLRTLEISEHPVAGGVPGFGVRELELRLVRVERDLTDQKPSPNPPSHWEGVAQQTLLDRLTSLEESAVEDVGPAFEKGGQAFNSFGACCRSWLASKAPVSIDYLGHWVDPFSMSSFAEAQTRDANAKLAHKSMLAKAHFSGGSNEASVLFSFSDVLPSLVGSLLMPSSCFRR